MGGIGRKLKRSWRPGTEPKSGVTHRSSSASWIRLKGACLEVSSFDFPQNLIVTSVDLDPKVIQMPNNSKEPEIDEAKPPTEGLNKREIKELLSQSGRSHKQVGIVRSGHAGDFLGAPNGYWRFVFHKLWSYRKFWSMVKLYPCSMWSKPIWDLNFQTVNLNQTMLI